MRGAREAPVPRDLLNFRRASLLSRNEFESGTFTIVLHATSSFTYVSVIYGANFPFKSRRPLSRPKGELARGAGSGGMLSRKILKFDVAKTAIYAFLML